jgi:dynein heavy chain
MDGAAWSSKEGGIVESAPKKLFAPMPLVLVSATSKTAPSKRAAAVDLGPYGGYECPVYKYPSRMDKYIVFRIMLPSKDHKPQHWILRGVALVCATGQ